jgi:hypothetical protein
MRVMLLFLIAVATIVATSTAFSSTEGTTRRRDVLASLLLGGSLTVATPNVNAAEDADISSIFLGTYTDPVNHPGGTRSIEFTGAGFAGFQLATVKGGGGRGEPDSYELPAMVFACPGNQKQGGKWCITIDFTPKGGPKDFNGYWDEKEKGIRFVLDDNFWPKQ